MDKSTDYLVLCGGLLLIWLFRFYRRHWKGKPRLEPVDLFFAGCLFWGYYALIAWITGRTILVFPSIHFGKGTYSPFMIPPQLADVWAMVGVIIVFAMMTAIYHFYPRLTGRKLQNSLGLIHFWASFLGIFMLLFQLYRITDLVTTPPRSAADLLAEPGIVIRCLPYVVTLVLAAQLLFVINLVYSGVRGRRV
jgi:heme/copper-type cytochrome/quinol oxidase subunit 1